MKAKVSVWTLAWDTQLGGTDCLAFASEREFASYFRHRILSETKHADNEFVKRISTLFDANEIGDAYSLWQDSYKHELDTYNWDVQQLEVELDPTLQLET